MKKLAFVLFFALSAVTALAQDASVVFEAGLDGYATFRIPAIVKAADGSLIAFAEARRDGKSDNGNIDLVMRKSFDCGRTWREMKVIWDDGGNTCGNPAPVVVGNSGEILLVATWNLGKDKERDIERNLSADTRRVYVFRSEDNGENWSGPVEITPMVKNETWGWYATGPCHSIVKKRNPDKGRIIIPCNHSELDGQGVPRSFSHIIYSDDDGKNWALGAITEMNGNESSVAELGNGDLLLNMRRSTSADSVRYYAISKDGGRTFEREGRQEDLVGPRCQGSILNLTGENGKPTRTLIFSNPKNSGKRMNLSLSISRNNGRDWKCLKGIFSGKSAYSDIVRVDASHVGVLFENGEGDETYRRISFVIARIEK